LRIDSRSISVIIPTLNAGRYLKPLLTRLMAQTLTPEIIIVDSSSDDDTENIAHMFPVTFVRIRRRDFSHGSARNYAAGLASGHMIAFLTQDALPTDSHLLEHLIEPLAGAEIAASYGRQIASESAAPPEQFLRRFNYPEKAVVKGKESIPLLGIKTFFFSNVCSAVRRKEFEKLGGFDPDTLMNEDMLYAAKLILNGYKTAYVPQATVLHEHDFTLRQVFGRYFDIGVSVNGTFKSLDEVKIHGEGVKFFRQEIRFFQETKRRRWIPYAFIEALCKFLGFNVGEYHRVIPNFLKRKISRHKNYWPKD
jgi:rhamnosyltransferase